MMKSPTDVLTDYLRDDDARQLIDDLRAAGYIIVRHDAIRLAQAAARYEAENDNEDRRAA